MNNLANITPLKNSYFIIRHGESEANIARLITSDPAECISNYGLTQNGKKQVEIAIKLAKLRGWLDNETVIYSSDFKRAVETAELARKVLDAKKVHLSPALRERFFGDYDGEYDAAYITIWAQDERAKLDQKEKGVESANGMLNRLMVLIRDLEAQYKGECLLLVSHGDPLQVLRAAFAGLGPDQRNSLSYINLGELRKLTLKSHKHSHQAIAS